MEDIKQDTQAVADQAQEQANQLVTFIQGHIPDMISFGVKVLLALIIFFVGRLIIKGIRKVVSRSFVRAGTDKGVKQFVDSLLKYCLYIVLILAIISGFGISTASVAALFASGGVAIGLALQGSLSNFASGVLILILKPFAVGDYIIEDSNKNEGTVIEIQIFYTKLQTTDGKIIILPNSMMTENSIINVTAANTRQLDLKLRISYETDLDKVKEILLNLLKDETRILRERNYSVFVDDLTDAAVIVGMRAYIKTEDYYQTRIDLLERIKKALDENNIKIPAARIDVNMRK